MVKFVNHEVLPSGRGTSKGLNGFDRKYNSVRVESITFPRRSGNKYIVCKRCGIAPDYIEQYSDKRKDFVKVPSFRTHCPVCAAVIAAQKDGQVKKQVPKIDRNLKQKLERAIYIASQPLKFHPDKVKNAENFLKSQKHLLDVMA